MKSTMTIRTKPVTAARFFAAQRAAILKTPKPKAFKGKVKTPMRRVVPRREMMFRDAYRDVPPCSDRKAVLAHEIARLKVMLLADASDAELRARIAELERELIEGPP